MKKVHSQNDRRMKRNYMVIKRLDTDQIEEMKRFFVEIFSNEPWNDDWSNKEQLHLYMMDLTGNRNSLSLGLYL